MEHTSNGPVMPGLGMPSAKPKAKSIPNPREKRPTTAYVGFVFGGGGCSFAYTHDPDRTAEFQNKSNGGADGSTRKDCQH